MIKRTLICVAFILVAQTCGFAQNGLDTIMERCLILNSQINDWRAEYFDDVRFNDSVIEAAAEGLSICEPESWFEQEFTFSLVEAYVRAKRYDDALNTAYIHHKVIENFYPYHYNMLYDEVMVVKCHDEGNLEQRNIYIAKLIAAIEPYIKKHRRRIDFLCSIDDFENNISKYHKEVRLWGDNAIYYFLQMLIDPFNTRAKLASKKYSLDFIDYVEHSVKCIIFFDCNSNIKP